MAVFHFYIMSFWHDKVDTHLSRLTEPNDETTYTVQRIANENNNIERITIIDQINWKMTTIQSSVGVILWFEFTLLYMCALFILLLIDYDRLSVR